MTSYAAVVLYYRAGETVWDTVRSLQGQTLAPAQIVLVDNGSNDGVCDAPPDDVAVTIIRSSHNAGYSSGLWLGTKHVRAASDWILYVTHEVRLDRESAEELVTHASAQQAAQAGPIVMKNGSPSPWSAGGGFNRRGNATHVTQVPDAPREALWLEGCCHLIRRELASEHLFDPKYFLYWDDVDISASLHDVGPIIVVPTARCWQDTGGQPLYFGARNRIMFWRKHDGGIRTVVATMEPLARAAVDLLLRWRPRAAAARAVGVRDGLSGALSPRHFELRG